MTQIGYADFIRVLSVHNPLDWLPGLEVRKDGVWNIPARDDDDCTPEERAILSEHPENDFSKPVLPFPCDYLQLDKFLSWLGMPLEVFIGDKWRSGQDIVKEYGLQGFQLFELLKEGVQARTITGLEVVNEDALERRGRESLAELERIEFLREGAAASGIVIAGRRPVEPRAPKRTDDEIKKAAQAAFEKQPKDVLVIPDGCEAISYTLSYDDNKKRTAAILRAVGFLFKSVDVIKYMWAHNIKSVESSPSPAQQEQSKTATDITTPAAKNSGHGISGRRKDFITAQELLTRWPSIDLGELLGIIEKSVPVGTYFNDDFIEQHGGYRFYAWHPLEYRPIKLTEVISNPPQEYDDVPFEINGIRELYPLITKCLFSIEQVEKLEKKFPDLPKNETIQSDTFSGYSSKEENKEPAISLDAYVQKRRADKMDTDVIAAELCDKKGPFKLPYLECARALKLEGDDKHIDIRTLKQRGVRAVKRGKQKILQQRKTTS